MFCKQGFMGEILNAVVQRLGKVFNERAAAGGTCLIQLHAVDGAVFDLDTFHILSADIKDTVHFRIEERSRIIMRDRLHLALVQQKSGFDQSLSVAGGAGVSDMCAVRHLLIDS